MGKINKQKKILGSIVLEEGQGQIIESSNLVYRMQLSHKPFKIGAIKS